MKRLSLWVLLFFVALLLVKTGMMARDAHRKHWDHPKWEQMAR